MPQDAPNPPTAGPSAARAAGALVVVQAALLVVASVVLAVEGFRPETVDRVGAELLAAIGVASAVAIAAFSSWIGTRWQRSTGQCSGRANLAGGHAPRRMTYCR